MQNPDFANVERDPVAGGMIRPAIIRKIGVPYWDMIPIMVIPLAVMIITGNPVWFVVLLIGLIQISRAMSSSDYNKRRVKWLSYRSGAKSPRGRAVWGGHSIDPLGNVR